MAASALGAFTAMQYGAPHQGHGHAQRRKGRGREVVVVFTNSPCVFETSFAKKIALGA